MKFRFPVLLWVLGFLNLAASAQTPSPPQAPGNSPPATVLVHSTPALNEIRLLFRQGLNRQIVEKATAALAKSAKPDPEFLYWRGYARRRLSLFDAARQDLAPLGNVTGWRTFPTAARLATELDTLIQLRPPHEYDIRRYDKVIFRVYHDEDDEFFHTVIAALPKGYEAASSFVGVQAAGIPIFVFGSNHYDQFFKFFTVYNQSPPRFWWRILSHDGAIVISQSDQRGGAFPANYPNMAQLMSHEMTHQLMRRILGNPKDFPSWFSEGAARCGEATYLPSMNAQNDQQMRQLLAQNAILPLAQLVSPTQFQDSVDQLKNGVQKGDSYAQGFNMTRYLGTLLKGEKMSAFLLSMQEKGGFQPALQAGTGLTMEEFYQSWLKSLTKNTLHTDS